MSLTHFALPRSLVFAGLIAAGLSVFTIQAHGDSSQQASPESEQRMSDSYDASGSQSKWRGSGHHSHGISHGDHHSYGISGRPDNTLSPKPETPPHHDRQDYNPIPNSGYRQHQDTRITYPPGYFRQKNHLNNAPSLNTDRSPLQRNYDPD